MSIGKVYKWFSYMENIEKHYIIIDYGFTGSHGIVILEDGKVDYYNENVCICDLEIV